MSPAKEFCKFKERIEMVERENVLVYAPEFIHIKGLAGNKKIAVASQAILIHVCESQQDTRVVYLHE